MRDKETQVKRVTVALLGLQVGDRVIFEDCGESSLAIPEYSGNHGKIEQRSERYFFVRFDKGGSFWCHPGNLRLE